MPILFKKDNRGFTLIELLVVIAIIGLLATMAVTSLKNAQQKSRDAKRISDIKQIRTALELYLDSNVSNLYPINNNITLGIAGALCLSSSGFGNACTGTTFMGVVPKDPGVDSTGGTYVYSYLSADGSTYTITFGLANKTGSLQCATYDFDCCTASPTGVTCS